MTFIHESSIAISSNHINYAIFDGYFLKTVGKIPYGKPLGVIMY